MLFHTHRHFKIFFGNITFRKKAFKNHNEFSYNRELVPIASGDQFKGFIRIEFKLGKLHIVSYGSRGTELISGLQIATVFETRI